MCGLSGRVVGEILWISEMLRKTMVQSDLMDFMDSVWVIQSGFMDHPIGIIVHDGAFMIIYGFSLRNQNVME